MAAETEWDYIRRIRREEREDAFAERYNAALDRHYGYAPKPKKPDDKTPLD